VVIDPDHPSHGAIVVEDGFVIGLTGAEHLALCIALDQGQALELGPPERRWRLAQAG